MRDAFSGMSRASATHTTLLFVSGPGRVEVHGLMSWLSDAAPRFHYGVANAWLRFGRTEAAVKAFGRVLRSRRGLHEALALDPGSVPGMQLLAEVFAGLDRYDDATTLAREVCALDAHVAVSRAILAGVLSEARHLDEARKEANAAVEIGPVEAGPDVILGGIWLKMNDGAAALVGFQAGARVPGSPTSNGSVRRSGVVQWRTRCCAQPPPTATRPPDRLARRGAREGWATATDSVHARQLGPDRAGYLPLIG